MNLLGQKQKQKWLKYLINVKPYFKYCENADVLEIGPFDGLHTNLILEYNPKKITLVEPNDIASEKLKIMFPNATVVIDDIFKFSEQIIHFDTVVCCGVLYHFHSPVYLLEQIVNNFTPLYLMIESIFDDDDDDNSSTLTFCVENDNCPGHRYKNNRSAKMSITFRKNLLIKIMENMDYVLIESGDVSVKGHVSKFNSKILIFKRL